MLNHHAYYLEGSTELLPAVEARARKDLGFAKNSPDVHVQVFEKFGIEESRALIAKSVLKATAGRALYIVATASIQSEAQQALLKLLEEPSPGTVLIFIVPFGSLLPTVRSRCLPFPFKRASSSNTEVKAFLKASGKERSEQIAEMLEDEEGTRERAREFLNALEGELYAAFSEKEAARAPLARGMEDIGLFRMYLGDRAPSIKMMLEHLAATLPNI